jgi:hypothetical protein
MAKKLGPAADAATAATTGEHHPGVDLVIVEGISSTFYYHLGLATDPTRSLCGMRTMATMLPLECWAKTGHLNERWCSRCEVDQVRRQEGVTATSKKSKKSS